jgi:SHS2 domain-containing protein
VIQRRFLVLPHTADLRLRVWGEDDIELASNAVLGTMRVATGRTPRGDAAGHEAIARWPAGSDGKVVRAVNEALFWLYSRRMCSLGVRRRGNAVELLLRPLAPVHPPLVEVKAATLHDLRPARDGCRLVATLTLDL